MKTYVVYISTQNMSKREAKKHLKVTSKDIKKQAGKKGKKERWIFIQDKTGRSDILQLN
jgi:hypothetical protein